MSRVKYRKGVQPSLPRKPRELSLDTSIEDVNAAKVPLIHDEVRGVLVQADCQKPPLFSTPGGEVVSEKDLRLVSSDQQTEFAKIHISGGRR